MAVNSLSSSLNKLGSASCSASSGSRHDELVKTSQRWAAQTFFGTILKQMRNSPFKSELFSGGKQSEAFHELYDQHLAERMARSTGRRLADSIAKHIERQGRANKTAVGAPSAAASTEVEGGTHVQAA